jgi:oligoribonuclease NrnB/cAMP/cGMP phosphodiesterase (DHH superfamily)
VAACRLAWQYFNQKSPNPFLPTDVQFKNREVSEPLAVRLAGEYDIWDHRGDGDLEFQFGLDAQGGILDWDALLSVSPFPSNYFNHVLNSGGAAMKCYAKRDADIMRERSFATEFEGLKFLCLNTARCNSNTFAAKDIPSTGHDALMAFYFNGEAWNVSLYHAAHRKDIDLSLIAVKFGGGGHRGACGFRTDKPPFLK